ncbi:MAG: SAM-dependent methyltransferase [Burkholderiales bacterium RIFCSPLOWO2_02_FULL_57_36]|nr:MAG: SAM-dependent methyltransferase [Burkholderiales bacterium RIFCSPLOWO2_02_FULL_57_36]
MAASEQANVIAGTEGYSDDANSLIARYESVSFTEKHAAVLHLLPARPSKVLDLGAGTGADAAWLAEKGHWVLAVEPTDPLRAAASALHPSTRIEWLADSLPSLRKTMAREESFDRVLITAVWMHLAKEEREQAMPNVASLLAPDGLLIMALRHGPAPANRRVFDVTAEETIELAERAGLKNTLKLRTDSAQPINRQAGVMWSRLAFQK